MKKKSYQELKKEWSQADTDEKAAAFLDNDLSEFIKHAEWEPVTFEFEKKDKAISLRLPGRLLARVKAEAKKHKMNYQRFIRIALEGALRKKEA